MNKTNSQKEAAIKQPKIDGGPAFPSTSYWDARFEEYRPPETAGGASLRDIIAIAALQGMLAATTESERKELRARGMGFDSFSRSAYECADSMIAVRNINKWYD